MTHLLDVYEVKHEGEVYRASWFNPERTIAVLEVKKAWKWEDVIEIIGLLSKMVIAQPNPVYTVYYYRIEAPFLPKGVNLRGLRKLMQINPPNEQMVIFVQSDRFIISLIQTASKLYGLRHVLSKYRYFNSWEMALAEIYKHQSAQQNNAG